MRRATFAALLAGVCATGAAAAGDPSPAEIQDHYCARLSRLDHYGSRGQRLVTVGAILRQDRANFYKPGRRDKVDQPDHVLGTRVSREAFEDRIDDLRVKLRDRRDIINGTPRVCVTIKGAAIAIAIVDDHDHDHDQKR